MNITPKAIEQITLLTTSGSFRINAVGDMVKGYHVDLILNDASTTMDVTILNRPSVIMDVVSLNKLSGQTVDYDDATDEFVISTKRGTP